MASKTTDGSVIPRSGVTGFRSGTATPRSGICEQVVRDERDDIFAAVKRDLLVIKWMTGFVLTFQVAILARLFLH